MPTPPAASQAIWTPPQELQASCALARFLGELRRDGVSLAGGYEELHRWSVSNPAIFWPRLSRFLDLGCEGDYEPAFGSEQGPTPLAKRWFPNLRLNFAKSLLQGAGAQPAIISWSEDRLVRRLDFADLRTQAGGVQRHLVSLGITAGDRVFAYLPNIPEALASMLGAASIGAVWASCGTDYQLQGLLARAERVKPRVLVAARSYLWRGQAVDLTETVERLVERTPSVEQVILVDYLAGPNAGKPLALRLGVSVRSYAEITAGAQPIDLSQTFPFSQPLYLMFSSGTTGSPKGIVHGAGGTLLEHKKEMILHADVRPGDRVFYQTSTSWMMWNWVASALACDATVVMYDGDPMIEEGMILWRLAHEEGVTHFGTSAAFLGALERQGRNPAERYAMPALRALMSTGSTLYPAQFDYVMRSVKPLWIQSISGGTDIIGCFGLGCPLKPVIRGEVQAKSLGYDVRAFGQDGAAVVGQEGELVCCSPAPSMPVFFLDDPDGVQYRAAYFAEYGTVWRHGDLIKETPEGGLLFLGRSDATLKPSGVRVATADIYAALQAVPRVQQALAVGYVPAGAASEKIVLFVVLPPGETLSESLKGEIAKALKSANTFFVPALILQAPDLPRTANNKLSELTVKRILRGEEPGNRSALANPECLPFFEGAGRDQVRAAL